MMQEGSKNFFLREYASRPPRLQHVPPQMPCSQPPYLYSYLKTNTQYECMFLCILYHACRLRVQQPSLRAQQPQALGIKCREKYECNTHHNTCKLLECMVAIDCLLVLLGHLNKQNRTPKYIVITCIGCSQMSELNVQCPVADDCVYTCGPSS